LTELLKMNTESIQRAATTVREGGLVVYPTDTVYGLGCNPFDERAVARVASVKQRTKENLPVLVSNLERARLLGDFKESLEIPMKRFWPGPLTIVVPCRASLPLQVIGKDRMIGLRIPGRVDTLDLISRSGGFLVGTSANISGLPSLRNPEDALKVFDGKVDFILDGGSLATHIESTVVRQADYGLQLLREGAIKYVEFEAALATKLNTK
jgi:L-threonylcarbamoyladenylate synthase